MVDTVRIEKVNEVFLRIDAEASIIMELSDYFTFDVPGAKFSPQYKAKFWDGKIRLLNNMTRLLYAGLLPYVVSFCNDRSYECVVSDEFKPIAKYGEESGYALADLLKSPYELRDYQNDAFVECLNSERKLLLSPTGSGKSFIIYLLTRWHLAQNKRVLIVVPTTSLVHQMASDFVEYNNNKPMDIHKIMAGAEKDIDSSIVITTWQSIYKLKKPWFQQFDVVIGDLFLPGKQGTALLYTVEQFEAVKMRLAPGGVFAQWLALYQLSEDEFLGIARSFRKIFPDARVWRGDFFGKGPIVALVGTKNGEPLDGERMLAAWRRLEARGAVKFGPAVESLPFLFQAGALAGAVGRIDAAPLHTDDHPWIAFDAPISKRSRSAGAETAFVGQLLADFELALLRGMPVQDDPYLAQLTTAQQQYVEGGLVLYRYAVASGSGSSLVSQPALTRFKELVPSRVRPPLDDWMQ